MLKPDVPPRDPITRPGPNPPALTALVVYLRPAPRRAVLGALADLGILAVEHQGEVACRELAEAAAADLVIVFADQQPAALRMVRGTVAGRGSPTVVSVCAAESRSGFLDAGAALCVTDDELATSGGVLLAPVAASARARRRQLPSLAGPGHVFRALTFDPLLPALSLGPETRPLSRSERAVLERLAATPGRPVERTELEQCAKPPGIAVRPGFLKAIILRLRRKAEELGGDPNTLQTVRGFGYVLTG